jgi:hypothetical protein
VVGVGGVFVWAFRVLVFRKTLGVLGALVYI